MSLKTALAVTSISKPNAVLHSLAEGAKLHGWDYVVAGDSKTPDFQLDGCRFLSLEDQRGGEFETGRLCPTRSYARKNLAYLAAIAGGAEVVVETDDDNYPREAFWNPRSAQVACRPVREDRWVNVYGYFTDQFIYSRGLPLDFARQTLPIPGTPQEMECLIQQGLADENPDVDAIYRMLFTLPVNFDPGIEPVALGAGAWCPFNSQNTTFFAPVFPLLYLPAYCTMRMTDIWRGFVAQRVLHHLGHFVMFHGATVWQERNEHDLHNDYLLEMPGYEYNNAIRKALIALDFGVSRSIPYLLELCYECLIRNGWVGEQEEKLLTTWLADLKEIG